MSRQPSQQAVSQNKALPPSPSGTAAKDSPEQHLLLLLLHHERLGKPLSLAFPHSWIDTSQPPGALLHRFLNELQHDNWPGRDQLEELLHDSDERALVASLLFDPPTFEDPLKIAAEGIKLMRTRALEPRLRKIELDLASLRADSTVDAISLIKERTELQRQLRQPIGLPAAD